MKTVAACLNPVGVQGRQINAACLSRVRSQRVRPAVSGLNLVPLRVSVASEAPCLSPVWQRPQTRSSKTLTKTTWWPQRGPPGVDRTFPIRGTAQVAA
jgi:hypothetical protein